MDTPGALGNALESSRQAARKRIQRPRSPYAPSTGKREKIDWKFIDQCARDGLFESIPVHIYERYRKNIHMIRADAVRRSHQAQLVAPPIFADIAASLDAYKDTLVTDNIEIVP